MWLYNIAIVLYSLAVKIASLWMPKAKLWSDGRKDIFRRMAQTITPEDRILWIHVASLGEFEQGRPLIEKIKAEYPQYKILLTFFSPSGYELRKGYENADYIFYLPVDTPRNVRRFLKIAHPEIAIFVKYEFWLNMLFALSRANVKTYIVSAIFRRDSIFFKNVGVLWRRALESFNIIFVQNQDSKSLLSEIGVEHVVVAGDTRFDRVAQIAAAAQRNSLIEEFKGSSQLFVAGSTWPADEQILKEIIYENKQIKFIIAPHEIKEERIRELMELFPEAQRYTQIGHGQPIKECQILILDTMGQLSSIYGYASWAYIGGGFGVGIHNTLEASTFGLPMAFGPNYQKFKEARDMIDIGSATSISDLHQAQRWFNKLRDDEQQRLKASQKAREYTTGNQGATDYIIENIFQRDINAK